MVPSRKVSRVAKQEIQFAAIILVPWDIFWLARILRRSLFQDKHFKHPLRKIGLYMRNEFIDIICDGTLNQH